LKGPSESSTQCRRIVQGIGAFLLMVVFVCAASAAEKLAICHGSSIATAVIPLARLRGDFAAEGLDVDIRVYPSGFQALQAMLKGDCAFSAAAAPPVTYQSLHRNDFRILASLSSNSKDDRVIVRRDRGIRRVADLRGRTVAVAEGTSAHYLLDTLLMANGVAPSEVHQRYLPAQEVAKAFQRGEVDAAATWHPYLTKLLTEFGSKVEVLNAPGLVVSPFLLLVRSDYLQKHPAAVHAVLSALVKADRAIDAHPAKAVAQLAPGFGLSVQEMNTIWTLHDYQVLLSQSLFPILESVARWQIRLLPRDQQPPLPNYLDFLYPDALKAANPAAVTVID
jgi:NitT/TauT family transport system substrate-binding protein